MHNLPTFSLVLLNGIEHHFFPTIDSTNTWAKQNAHNFHTDKITIVTADQQTAGRGRLNRKWISPPGVNLYTSFCFFLMPNQNQKISLTNIPQILAISVVEILLELGFTAQLKWPNDILLNGKKLGGILSETTQIDEFICFIAGLGLNVNMTLNVLEGVGQPATSLLVEGKRLIEVSEILNLLQTQFMKNLTRLNNEGFMSFFDQYRQFLIHLANQSMQFHNNSEVLIGKFHSLNQDGSLNLELNDGAVKSFLVGEIQSL